MKCGDIYTKLPVSVRVGDHWIDGQIGNYKLGHTHNMNNWTGYVQVKFNDEEDDDGIIVRVPAAMVDSHLRERKAAA